MSEERIERDTLIAAPLERVWSLVAEPGWWVSDESTLTGSIAEEGQTTIAKHSEHGEFPVRVEKVDPPNYVAYSWVSAFPGEDFREGNSTLVEFTLTEEGDKTRLRVVETGISTLAMPEDNRADMIKDHTGGWGECLASITRRAERP